MHEHQTLVSYAVLNVMERGERTYCLANCEEVDGLNEDIAELIRSKTPFDVWFTTGPER